MQGLTRPEITKIVYNYIGVDKGYLGDFSYATHQDFYPLWCGLDIDPSTLEGTTKLRFIKILQDAPPTDQIKILKGVLAKYPPSADNPLRTEARAQEIRNLISRLEASPVVPSPSLNITSETVERAISDAEALIENSGATSGIDRVHTALHGFLLAACDAGGIAYGNDPSITELFKLLRHHHPKLQNLGSQTAQITHILKAFATILDALNPIRNNASIAHPNVMLLGEDEARLVINAARTILHYLDSKLA